MQKFRKNDVVQFNEKHKWCGCLGIVTDAKYSKISVGIPLPKSGATYIYCKPEEIEYIGRAVYGKEEDELY